MDFVSVRIITDNLDVMVEFYEKVTGVTADRPAPVFAELHFPSCTLALGHTSTTGLFNNAARPAHNETAIVEWVVDDVDTEYERLKPIVSDWEQEPTLSRGETVLSSSAIPMATLSTSSPPPRKRPSSDSAGSSSRDLGADLGEGRCIQQRTCGLVERESENAHVGGAGTTVALVTVRAVEGTLVPRLTGLRIWGPGHEGRGARPGAPAEHLLEGPGPGTSTSPPPCSTVQR